MLTLNGACHVELVRPHFHNEEAAYAYVEARIWPHGPVCPHCGGIDRISKMQGKSTRVGTYKCYQCRKPFTVKIGTIFEDSKVPMRIWLQAMYLIARSKALLVVPIPFVNERAALPLIR